MKNAICVAVSIIAFCAASQAQQIKLTDSARKATTAWISNVPHPVWRRDVAEATLTYCRELSIKLPRNTPREDDWVTTELNSLDEGRTARLMETVEFSRSTLTKFANECVKIAQDLTNKNLQPVKEAVLWIKLLRQLNDTGGTETNAKRLGLMTINEDPYAFGWWGGMRIAIIEQAILPLLEPK